MPNLARKPFERPMLAVLEALEVRAHVLGAPRRIAGQVGELVPVGVVRIDEDHRVVRRAAAERARARIPHAVDRLVVPLLQVLRIAAPAARCPRSGGRRSPTSSPRSRSRADGRRARRSRRRRPRRGSPPASSTSTVIAGFSEPRGDGPAAGAGADDDVVGVGRSRCEVRAAPVRDAARRRAGADKPGADRRCRARAALRPHERRQRRSRALQKIAALHARTS